MNNLYKRSITGALIVAFIIGCILLDKISFFFLFALIIFLITREFYNLCTFEMVKPQSFFGSIVSVIIFIMFYLFAQEKADNRIFIMTIPLIISFFLIELFRKTKHPFQNIAYTILGIGYTALPFCFFNFFVFQGTYHVTYSPNLLLGFFILIWTYDTSAYVFGLLIGSTPLFRRISPKKTWEGLIGGLIITGIIAWLLSLVFKEYTFFDWEVIAVIIVIMGTFGDLTESLFKRSINIKESGSILPGHGGMLDRFDGVLFAAPLVYTYLKMIY